ncbi:hypothetical protein [Chitinophaga rhizosphaerae]|uniref:hypothetical protein n=1 Tax=Chitinophaga rhizosphaerae TaxID=1864947 RepID=UPI000F7FF36B|nr:hypothetical protein [Chitinophaga rhizosphaerae]
MNAYKEVTIYFGLADEKDVSLADILSCIPLGERREWALLHMEALGHPGDLDVLKFEAEAEIHGIAYAWDALHQMQDRFAQVIEMMVVGGERVSHLRRAMPFEEILEAAEYVVELVDGGFWVVHTRSEQAVGNFCGRFSRVEVVEL